MSKNFQFETKKNHFSTEDKNFRKKNLNLFNKMGFPNKKIEDWKFTDFNKIVSENFQSLNFDKFSNRLKKKENIKDFNHNRIDLVNGFLVSSNFDFEDKNKIIIQENKHNEDTDTKTTNSMINLNNALSDRGYHLEILKGYQFKKPLIIYNYFSGDLKNKIINNKNLIKIENGSELEIIECNYDQSNFNFIKNTFDTLILEPNSKLISYTIQMNKSYGHFYKYSKTSISKNSNYNSFLFPSGLKFNKIEEQIELKGEYSGCKIQSASYLNSEAHHEIKTAANHLKPNCKSHQNIKNVLAKNSVGVYQGKIFVQKEAQKTDAYQLSKGLILDESAEFNAKPELEIYADDVKCSHGSTSGNLDEDSIYYLMTRGMSRKSATSILVEGFLFDIADSIINSNIKDFIQKNLKIQIYGNKKN